MVSLWPAVTNIYWAPGARKLCIISIHLSHHHQSTIAPHCTTPLLVSRAFRWMKVFNVASGAKNENEKYFMVNQSILSTCKSMEMETGLCSPPVQSVQSQDLVSHQSVRSVQILVAKRLTFCQRSGRPFPHHDPSLLCFLYLQYSCTRKKKKPSSTIKKRCIRLFLQHATHQDHFRTFDDHLRHH